MGVGGRRLGPLRSDFSAQFALVARIMGLREVGWAAAVGDIAGRGRSGLRREG